MKKILKNKIVLAVVDLLTSPFTLLAAVWLKLVRKGLGKMPVSEAVFMKVGVLPVVDHYYEPLINPKKHLEVPSGRDRDLPGLDLNEEGQLDLLQAFTYQEELLSFPMEASGELSFHYNNHSFESGDAEYLYNMVRYFKPARIIEIGSGHSSLLVKNALEYNRKESPEYACKHTCIEPYEMPWLEKTGVEVIRKKVEEVDLSFFKNLRKEDILFIDSSHMIRPQGDVLREYLQILPILHPGVIVHIHDIFTPADYPDEWIYGHRFWNEHNLLEAFLSFNTAFKVIGAVNYLHHHHREKLAQKCPVLAKQPGREPGSFWIVRQ